jgi:hypothetical protein
MHKFREGFKALKTNVSEGPIRRPERGEWMGADKKSSQELGLCPQITSEESRIHLPRSRNHNGPTDPRNKLDQA